MVTYDSSYSEWYSAVAADRPDDVWISYDRQGEGADQFRVYAQHYDGAKWSAPERLDNDSAYRDAVTAICTDSDGLPIVVWEGTSYARTNSDIYYNRCVRAPAVAEVGDDVAQTRWLSGHTFCGRDGIALTLNLNVASRVSVALLDLAGRCRASQDAALARAGPNRVRMRAQVPCGVYFVCVRAGTLTEVHKVLIVDSD
jgi:hypothetical protein